MLRSSSKGKMPAVKETARYVILVGGDNAAESQTGHIKNTMRRVGNIGRFATGVVEKKNVQTMAAAALLRRAGFQTVLESLRQYRVACSSGIVSVAPKDAFETKGVRGWLFKEVVRVSCLNDASKMPSP